jgi:hypothetical protein
VNAALSSCSSHEGENLGELQHKSLKLAFKWRAAASSHTATGTPWTQTVSYSSKQRNEERTDSTNSA